MTNDMKIQIAKKYIVDTPVKDEDLQQELYEAALRWQPEEEWMGCPTIQLMKHLLKVDSEYRLRKAGLDKKEECCGLSPQIRLTINFYL